NVGVAVDLTDITDFAGNEVIEIDGVASAVNFLRATNGATGSSAALSAQGDDTNVGLELSSKGTGSVILWSGNSAREILIGLDTANAVNELTITPAATAAAPKLSATGGDTNISLTLAAKGTGCIQTTQALIEKMTQTALADTATVTAAQLMTKIIDGTPTAAATYTLPTAALLVAGIANAKVGDSFEFFINNKSGGANTITVAGGTGSTTFGTLTVAQNVVRNFLIIITNVTGAAEAYTVYGIV
ncbi:MAG: hypothetical protein HYZ51_02065, partial [Candidatus Doudnabacteria bacterium]|nr:hypothetical protein [Candidatus Doudnabacteria bacterium]